MSTQFNGSGSFAANSAVSAFRAVAISTNRGVDLNAAATAPIGFTQQDAAAGDYVAVKFFAGPGTQKCVVTAAPITVGDAVYSHANGHISTTGTITVGRSLTTASASGSVIEFEPSRSV
tara:strand:+ start:581 stop:937 length:357 start_codon:yes stop_codon:yes gene_type:complete